MLLIFWIVIGIFVIWLGTGVLEGIWDVRKRPKEPMEWCHKHGLLRKKHVIQWEGTTVCPRCYYEAWRGGKK